MSSKYEYTEEMVQRMHDVFGDGVTEETIQQLVDEFEYPRRSVTAKARKLGFEVPKKPADAPKFTESETAELDSFLSANKGQLTAEEISREFAGGKFTARQITGKALSMEKTDHIKPAEKKVTPKTYTEAEEATIRDMAGQSGVFLEDIAAKLGKEVNSVRGKLLSMELKVPQRDKKDSKKDPYEGIDKVASKMTVEELADHFDKTPRGVKTVLARRRLVASDYTPKTVSAESD